LLYQLLLLYVALLLCLHQLLAQKHLLLLELLSNKLGLLLILLLESSKLLRNLSLLLKLLLLLWLTKPTNTILSNLVNASVSTLELWILWRLLTIIRLLCIRVDTVRPRLLMRHLRWWQRLSLNGSIMSINIILKLKIVCISTNQLLAILFIHNFNGIQHVFSHVFVSVFLEHVSGKWLLIVGYNMDEMTELSTCAACGSMVILARNGSVISNVDQSLFAWSLRLVS
jgi:hypothetical protein